MSQVPPPRYRIVERDRRLIVIDNWAGDKTPPSSFPQVRPTASLPPTPSPSGRDLLPRTSGGSANRIARAGEDGGTLLRQLALAACAGAEDAEGRPIFTSASWFDSKAKREFSLGRSGVERLGGTVLAFLIFIGLIAILAFAIGFEALFVPVFLFVVVGKNIPAIGTRWVDRLEKLPVD
ncbi:MAG: hypothetical protein P0Y59_18565 [Candidatus Sphingomonas phytovorans]|nr:hypothetical protein [Sphingomonas sp.]WEJ98927.1 MAG: hypothetical protein P0Y59_18565 [Sphingomonas sp.]